MLTLLQTLREEFDAKLKTVKDMIPRNIPFVSIENKISVFIGMRRSGKTTFICQQILDLLEHGVGSAWHNIPGKV